MSIARSHRLLAVLFAGSLALAACGSDDGASSGSKAANDASATPAGEASSDGDTEGSNGDTGSDGADGIDVDAALDAVSTDAKGDALVYATGADRYAIEDGVLHLYLGSDSKVPPGGECMIVTSVLSDGETAIVHTPDGQELDCS